MHEYNHAVMLANTLVHRQAIFALLTDEIYGSRPDSYDFMESSRNVFEGIVKAYCELDAIYRTQEERIVSAIRSIFSIEVTPFTSLERNKISSELVWIVDKLIEGKKAISIGGVLYCVSRAILTIERTDRRELGFEQVLTILRDSITKLQSFCSLPELSRKIISLIYHADPPNLSFRPFETHVATADALDYFHLALEACATQQSAMPLIKILPSLLNLLVGGVIFPYLLILVDPIGWKFSSFLYFGDDGLKRARRQLINDIKKGRCPLCILHLELLEDLLKTDYSRIDYCYLSKVDEVFNILWNFLEKVERFWQNGPRSSCDCGIPFDTDLKPPVIIASMLDDLESWRGLFSEASKGYSSWFEINASGEAMRFLRQFYKFPEHM